MDEETTETFRFWLEEAAATRGRSQELLLVMGDHKWKDLAAGLAATVLREIFKTENDVVYETTPAARMVAKKLGLTEAATEYLLAAMKGSKTKPDFAGLRIDGIAKTFYGRGGKKVGVGAFWGSEEALAKKAARKTVRTVYSVGTRPADALAFERGQ